MAESMFPPPMNGLSLINPIDPAQLQKNTQRIYEVCDGCRRCFNLCPSFNTLLNGIDHLALLRSRYGPKKPGAEKIIAATIAVESERVAPGHIVHRSPFARLNVSSAGRALLGGTVEHLQQMGFECRFVDDEPTLMWGKLVFLAPFALSTTAADKTTGEILSDPVWRELGLSCLRETAAVAVAEGAKQHAQLHAERRRPAQDS